MVSMTWTEIQSSNDMLSDIKSFLVREFSKIYSFSRINDDTVFSLPDGLSMSIFTMHGKGFGCLGMNYKAVNSNDDGDLYYPDDYDTPNELFLAMLEETRR